MVFIMKSNIGYTGIIMNMDGWSPKGLFLEKNTSVLLQAYGETKCNLRKDESHPRGSNRVWVSNTFLILIF